MWKFLLSCMLITIANINAQTPSWQWAKNASSTGAELAWDVTYDNFSGNTYLCGSFNGNLSGPYGASLSSSYGAKDGFVAKYDPNGNVLWAFKIGGTNDEEVKSIATDNLGDVYITGYFRSVCDFDPSGSSFNLTPTGGAGSQDGFLAKYTSSGAFVWAIKFGNSGIEDAWRIYADVNGIYLTGSYNGSATFYSTNAITKTTSSSNSLVEFYGAKYNSSGVVQWVVSAGSNKEDEGFDVVADASNVYFVGYYSQPIDLFNASGTLVATLADQGGNKPNAFIFAMTQTGTYAWSNNVVSNDDDYGLGIAQDATGIYITGSIKATADFKYPGPTFTKAVIGGTDFYIAKIAKSTGNFLWISSQTGSSGGDEAGYAIKIDGNNNLIVTGNFKNTLNYSTYGGPNLTTSGNEDVFVGAFNPSNGNFLWVQQCLGNGKDVSYGLAVNATGAIYVAGEYANALTVGTFTLPTNSSNNIFIAKTGCDIATNNTVTASQTICSGSSPVGLTGSVPLGGNTYAWQVSANTLTWTNASGTYTNQNYNPPSLTSITYYKRDVTAGGTCTNISSSSIITITVNQPPTISNAGITQSVCAATATLAATSPTVGTGVWSVITGTGSVTSVSNPSSQVTSLSNGTNSFLWTVSNGVCPSSTSTVTIIRNAIPTSFAGTTQTVCATSLTLAATNPTVGSGIWSVTTGTGNVTSVSNASSQVTALSTGTNVFLWTVSNGVCPTATSAVTIIRNVMPTSFAGTTQTVCASTATLAATNPTVGSGIWSVTTGTANVTSASNASSQVTGLSTGTNTFLWTVSNGVCPTATSAVTIIRNVMPTSFAGTTQTVCASTATLAATNPTVGSGIWSVTTGTGNVTSFTNPSSQVNSLSTGTNTFLWTVSNGVCPTATSAVTIIRNEMPTSFAGTSQTVCASTATLAATNPTIGSGNWSVTTGTGNVTSVSNPSSQVTSLSTGTNSFLWTVTNGVCPTATSAVTIIQNVSPTSFAGITQTVCANTATLSATNPTIGTGAWSVITGTGGIASINNPSSPVTALSTGTNAFVWTVSNGVCTVATSTVVIIKDEFPEISNAGNNFTVCSSTSTLNANNPLIGSGNWSILSGSALIVLPSNNQSAVSNLNPGQNTFVWTISNGTCPPSTSSVSVFAETPLAAANAGTDQQICSTACVLNANNSFGYGSWSILAGTGALSNVTDPNASVSGLSSGNTIFVWLVSKSNCPITSDTVFIKRDEKPTISNAGTDQLICGPTGTILANTPLIGNGEWQVLLGTGNIANLFSPQTNISNLSEGINIFIWKIKNGVCPLSNDTIIITSDLIPSDAEAGLDLFVCADQTNHSGISPLVGVGSWSVISGNCLITNLTANSIHINLPTVGTNILRWTVKNGICPDKTDDIEITRIDPPSIAQAGTDQTIEKAVTKLNAITPVIGSGRWSVVEGYGDFNNTNDPTTSVSKLAIGTNVLRWTTYNGNCPENTDDIIVYVKPLLIPNGFSPNGDGFNDKFVITSLEYYNNVKFSVFNRWGALLYASTDYKNDWAGINFNNEKLADDTYYYLLEIPELKGITGFIVVRQNK